MELETTSIAMAFDPKANTLEVPVSRCPSHLQEIRTTTRISDELQQALNLDASLITFSMTAVHSLGNHRFTIADPKTLPCADSFDKMLT
jgi:hypothetical protein